MPDCMLFSYHGDAVYLGPHFWHWLTGVGRVSAANSGVMCRHGMYASSCIVAYHELCSRLLASLQPVSTAWPAADMHENLPNIGWPRL